MSLEAFISGQSTISSTGVEQFTNDENELEAQQQGASSPSSNTASINNDDGSSKERGAILAERTSNLVSSYRDYISGQEDEEMMLGRTTGPASHWVPGANTSANVPTSSDPSLFAPTEAAGSSSSTDPSATIMVETGANISSTLSSAAAGGEAPLLREWNFDSHASKEAGDMGRSGSSQGSLGSMGSHYSNGGSSRGSHDILYDPVNDRECCTKKKLCGSEGRYSHPIYRSKKFKRFVLGVVLGCVMIGMMFVINTSQSNNNGGEEDDNLPDWDEELKEVLEEEDLLKNNNPNPNSEELLQMVPEGENPSVITEPAVELEQGETQQNEAVETPKEDGASVSTTGKDETYEDMAEEIASYDIVVASEGGEEVIAEPAQEAAVEAEQDNKGSPEPEEITTDQEGDIIDEEAALEESITRHILCCSINFIDTTTNKVLRNSSGPNSAAVEYARAEAHHPTWYDRSSGWLGTSYAEAARFCAAQIDANQEGMTLCPYDVYCPTGPRHIPFGGYREDDDGKEDGGDTGMSRSPIGDYPGGWVQVGITSTCEEYVILEEVAAYLEEEGYQQEENKVIGQESQVLAAAAEAATVAQFDNTYVPPSTDTATSSQTYVNQETIESTQLLHERFRPLWFTSQQGWNGGSHSDAVQFCSSIRGKQLCSYEAMCPHGAGQAVMGGRNELEFYVEGEQYAPILGGEDGWVMIGTMVGEQNSNKCMTYGELEGMAPEWGTDESREDLKQYIMCCSIN